MCNNQPLGGGTENMAIERNSGVLRHLHAIYGGAAVAGESDRELLDRFLTRNRPGGEWAFAALIERHGAMVLQVCRARLRDEHEAQDAFQAVFLVLVHKGRRLWVRDSLGPWLHSVSLRVAACARADAARRRRHERRWAAERPRAIRDDVRDDMGAVVHEELDRLPERMRAPLLLCDLEGLSHEEAARQLGWPIGTVKSRQARGRERLRSRLARRGFAPSVCLLRVPLIADAAPEKIVESTIQAAVHLAQAGRAMSLGSSAVAALTLGALRVMAFSRLRFVSYSLLLGAALIPAAAAVRTLARADDPPAKARAVPVRTLPDLLRDVRRHVLSEKDSPALAYSLTMIARAQFRAGDRDGARETAQLASEAAAKMVPKARCNALVAVAYTRDAIGNRAGGLKDLKEAEESAAEIDRDMEKVQAWLLVAEGQFDLGDRASATATIQIMSGVAFAIHEAGRAQMARLNALTNVVKSQAYIGDYEAAFRTVEAVGDDEDYRKGILLSGIADVAAMRHGWFFQPRQTITPKERPERLATVRRVNAILEKHQFSEEKFRYDLALDFADLGEFGEALRIARLFGADPVQHPHLLDPTVKPFLLGAIAVEMKKAGRGDEARTVIREAQDLVERDPKLASRRGDVGYFLARMGEANEALKLLASAGVEQCIQLLSEVADEQIKSGEHAAAKATLQRALAEAEKGVANADEESPKRTMKSIDAKGRINSPNTDPADFRNRCLGRVAGFQAKLGNVAAAVATLGKITNERDRDFAAAEIAGAQARAGDIEGTLRWVLSLESPAVRSQALRGLTQALAEP